MFPMRRMNRAERALNRGNTERAARKFHRLADQLSRRGDFFQSAAVRVEAAYAEAMGDNAAQAVHSIGYALSTLTNSGFLGRVGQIATAVSQVAQILRINGHAAEAAEIERMIGQALQSVGPTMPQQAVPAPAAPVQPGPAPVHGELPPTCGSCGGPLLPDVVEWHDPNTAVCPFCGSVVKAK